METRGSAGAMAAKRRRDRTDLGSFATCLLKAMMGCWVWYTEAAML